MSCSRINITLGTAGHIDHGKTALVKLLTGCDTDRLKAEKERGISIDLGFAPCKIADLEVGIVDVPGHENFIKTMVAGAAGMDAVMLVVAADDGVMPQTREHMEILTLLGVGRGVVALTKIDRVDEEHQALALEETKAFLRGTFLEDAPVCPVSSVTAEGFDGFFTTLRGLLDSLRPKSLDGVFRLPVDRAFSARGYGTIVAGIPLAGSAHIDDELLLLPEGLTSRIRQIEVYGRGADTVKAGQCAAINVRHWDARAIRRGHVVTVPGYFQPEEWFVGTLRLLRQANSGIKSGMGIKLHTGTSEVAAKVYPLEGNRVAAGEERLVQFHAAKPLIAGPGDHYIVRSLSPATTIGGGVLVEAVSRKLKRNRPGLVEELRRKAGTISDPRGFLECELRTAPNAAASEEYLAKRTKMRHERARELLDRFVDEGRALALSAGSYIHRDTAEEVGDAVLELLRKFHENAPESPGIPLERLRRDSRFDYAVLDSLVSLMKRDGRLVEQDGRLALAGHRPTFQDEDAAALARIEGLFLHGAYHPPSLEEVERATGISDERLDKLVGILQEHKRLVRVEGGILFHVEAVDRARAVLVDYLQREGRLESVKFKYLLETTRKYAIPLLDYFDQIGVTRRVGNTRFLRTRALSSQVGSGFPCKTPSQTPRGA